MILKTCIITLYFMVFKENYIINVKEMWSHFEMKHSCLLLETVREILPVFCKLFLVPLLYKHSTKRLKTFLQCFQFIWKIWILPVFHILFLRPLLYKHNTKRLKTFSQCFQFIWNINHIPPMLIIIIRFSIFVFICLVKFPIHAICKKFTWNYKKLTS